MLSFRVPGATSEKFVLAIVLLDAFLHSQGHEQPIRGLPVAGPLYGLQRLKNARMPGLTKSVVDVGVCMSSLYFTPESVPPMGSYHGP